MGWTCFAFDVKTVFIYRELTDEEVYVNIPGGYEKEANEIVYELISNNKPSPEIKVLLKLCSKSS